MAERIDRFMTIPRWWFWTWVVLLSGGLVGIGIAAWIAGGWLPLLLVLAFSLGCLAFVLFVRRRWVS